MKDEILSPKEIEFIRDLWRKYRRFKMELEDLLQEGRLLKFQNKDLKKELEKYCRNWSEDALSHSSSFQEKCIEEEERESGYDPKILEYLHSILGKREWEIWSRKKIFNESIYQIALELELSERMVYKYLEKAEEKIAEKREEIARKITSDFPP